MSALLFVAYSDMQLNVISFNTRLALDVIESREISWESCAVRVIVNDFSVCKPRVADSIDSPLLTSTIVDSLFSSQYACIVTLQETLNPLFEAECVPVWRTIIVPLELVENAEVSVALYRLLQA